MALCWWGLSFPSEDDRDGSDWKVAVYDVRYVLWCLLETAPKALIEDSSAESDSPSISTRPKNVRGPNNAESRGRGQSSGRREMVSQEGSGAPKSKRKIALTEVEDDEPSGRRLRKR